MDVVVTTLLGGVASLILLLLGVMMHAIRKLQESHDEHKEQSIEGVYMPIQDLMTWRDGADRRFNRIEKKVGINGE